MPIGRAEHFVSGNDCMSASDATSARDQRAELSQKTAGVLQDGIFPKQLFCKRRASGGNVMEAIIFFFLQLNYSQYIIVILYRNIMRPWLCLIRPKQHMIGILFKYNRSATHDNCWSRAGSTIAVH